MYDFILNYTKNARVKLSDDIFNYENIVDYLYNYFWYETGMLPSRINPIKKWENKKQTVKLHFDINQYYDRATHSMKYEHRLGRTVKYNTIEELDELLRGIVVEITILKLNL